MSPLVSIIIPCYNQARFVAKALDSALAQDYDALQIIVVNDGSTDNVASILAPYASEVRVTIISQENRGLPAARNRGIAAAQGVYFKFLDADDWLAPSAIPKQVAALQANPTLGFVYCDLVRVNENGDVVDDYAVANARRVLSGDILPSLLVGGYFTPHTVLVPRGVLEKVGNFDEGLGGTADSELWMRILCEGYTAEFLPEKLAYYRLHDENMSHDAAHMHATHQLALERIVTRYPQRVARALDTLIQETQRADKDAAWARKTLAAQQVQLKAQERALNTRLVRAARSLERLLGKS